MLTILAIWVVASVPLGILVGTVIREADEALPHGSSAIWPGALIRPATVTRAVAVDPSRPYKFYPSLF
jgi:hypothetical protein